MRPLAAILIATLGTWLATPARASVTCRAEVVRCAHCPRPKLLKVAALKADCCIVTPAVAHPLADSVQPRFQVPAPNLSDCGASIAPRLLMLGDAQADRAAAGSQPLGSRNQPLLC